jgi:hypothetical protein
VVLVAHCLLSISVRSNSLTNAGEPPPHLTQGPCCGYQNQRQKARRGRAWLGYAIPGTSRPKRAVLSPPWPWWMPGGPTAVTRGPPLTTPLGSWVPCSLLVPCSLWSAGIRAGRHTTSFCVSLLHLLTAGCFVALRAAETALRAAEAALRACYCCYLLLLLEGRGRVVSGNMMNDTRRKSDSGQTQ